jgi:hypothetical protein
MSVDHAPPPAWRVRRFLAAFALLFALSGTALIGPAIIAPTHTTAAQATVHSSCTISRCSAARTARSGWSSLGRPLSSGWYSWPYGRYNYTGGTFQNREGELPLDASYNEYDVYPRSRGAARDAYRIVVNRSTKETWFTPTTT